MLDLKDYFALAPTNEVGRKIWEKVEDDRAPASLQTKLYGLLSKAAIYYFGRDLSGASTSGIARGGDQGELALVRVNHARSLVNTQQNLILASKIVWQPIGTNSDYKSDAQVILAAAVLEYYWRDRQIVKYFSRCLEEAIVFGEGFVYHPWDPNKGETIPLPELDPEGNVTGVKKSGDFDFRNLSTWDVIRDPYKRSYDELDWVIVHTRENRYTLAALTQDPKLRQDILNAPVDNVQRGDYTTQRQDLPTDDISVFKLYHKRTPVIPDGREVVCIGPDTVLSDGPLSYTEIPLTRVYNAELFGTPYAYASFFEILGLQELVDSLNTCIATNQTTFGTQMIGAPDGTVVSPESFGGMKLLKYPAGSGEPKAIQLTKSPPEVFAYIKDLVGAMEQLMGLNSIARGEPQSGEQSGAALALLEAKAKQQASVLEGAYLRGLQTCGMGVIDTLRLKCPYPRIVSIAGVANKYLVRAETFDKDSFDHIERVQVDIGNPLSQTAAGRQELANMYIQVLGPKLTGEQIEQVLTTGRLEPLTQSLQRELLLIKSENESISRGEMPTAMADDDHVLHMREHRGEMANPEVRSNPQALQVYTQHQQEHWQLYNTVDPARLMLFGQQPPPQMGPPPGASPPPGGAPPGPPPGPPPPPSVAPNAPPGPELPSLPNNPSTGQPPPGLATSPGLSK